ncbi:Stk1 family PASTA domain-containing Ser/Thr kinase [Clostridium frigidicarnis]|uniref:non-specific serine/threonine protein kinase n=1 Tax=Clostridium frigidicarnis TaxID=84698 RepID=A0A1I0ZRW0_9CLOT|nr:Stk1 family PASTA domain-containing Ser/Thr kinase [Clostridium frigidicarnis]SFB26893.1 serine/threonine protein kinase [Clostridium frigidicarnis]
MRIGTILGDRYELIEKIGEGGMAEVYKAKCHKLNRFDAVKILKKEFASDLEVVEKFKREATAVANLSDNNIVNVLDVGTQDGVNYIVMEYVKGKTLKDLIREQGEIPYKKAVEYGIQITKALDCAHRNNIVHRDVKPQNILVTEDNIIKVTDFGIAKLTDSSTITNTNKILGSAHYFSPEQAKGNYVDYRTDIYSLGIVLYEMVTGKLPFDADSPVSVALKHIQEQPVPPIELNPSIPQSFNSLILKSIEKEPVKRYQSSKELINDLVKIEKDEKVQITSNNDEDQFTRVMTPIKEEDLKQNLRKNKAEEKRKQEEEEEEDYDDYYEDDKPSSGGKKKKYLIFSLIGILIVALGVISAAIMFKPNTAAKDQVKVPKIVGMTQEDAKKMLDSMGLKMEIVETKVSDKPEGTILECFPKEGETIEKDKEVRVVVSGGESKIKVPNLLQDYDVKAAEKILNTFDLVLGKQDEEYSDTVKKGNIIRQNPGVDTEVKKGDAIDIVVSKGEKSKFAKVPNLYGRSESDAKNQLESSKLSLGNVKTEQKTTNNKDDLNKNNTVIAQSLETGALVKEESAVNITIVVYTYEEPKPQLIDVPPLSGRTVGEARSILSDKGLTLDTGGFGDDFIIKGYSPNGQVVKGSTIKITSATKPNGGGENNGGDNNGNGTGDGR